MRQKDSFVIWLRIRLVQLFPFVRTANNDFLLYNEVFHELEETHLFLELSHWTFSEGNAVQISYQAFKVQLLELSSIAQEPLQVECAGILAGGGRNDTSALHHAQQRNKESCAERELCPWETTADCSRAACSLKSKRHFSPKIPRESNERRCRQRASAAHRWHAKWCHYS